VDASTPFTSPFTSEPEDKETPFSEYRPTQESMDEAEDEENLDIEEVTLYVCLISFRPK
jgi:hypothetical protein